MPIVVAFIFGIAAAVPDVLFYVWKGVSTIGDLALFWILLRYLIAFSGAFIAAYLGATNRFTTWSMLVLPPMFVGQGLFLKEIGEVSNLWPPILIVDVIIFLVCFPLMDAGRFFRKRRKTGQ